jgi:hypothetical protein
MTTPAPTPRDRWQALSDEPGDLVPFEPGPFDDLWDLLSVRQQQLVARGELSLEQLVDRVTSEPDDDLCPRCCVRVITRPRLRLCDTCLKRGFRDAHLLLASDAEALAATVMAKKHSQRARDLADPDRPRGHAPFRTCDDCGERLPARPGGIVVEGDNVCLSCRDLRERRHPECS